MFSTVLNWVAPPKEDVTISPIILLIIKKLNLEKNPKNNIHLKFAKDYFFPLNFWQESGDVPIL